MRLTMDMRPFPMALTWSVAVMVGYVFGIANERLWPGDRLIPATWGEAALGATFVLVGSGPVLLVCLQAVWVAYSRARLWTKGDKVAQEALQPKEAP